MFARLHAPDPLTPTLKAIIIGFAAMVAAGAGYAALDGWSLFGQKLEDLTVSYHKTYDNWWDVSCDATAEGKNGRCYAQYVDVYSHDPDFRAAMVEVIYQKDDQGQSQPVLTFDLEGDLDFRDVKMHTIAEGAPIQTLSLGTCSQNSCVITGEKAAAMLDIWRAGGQLSIHLPETGNRPKILSWPLQNAAALLDNLAEQRAKRGYP